MANIDIKKIKLPSDANTYFFRDDSVSTQISTAIGNLDKAIEGGDGKYIKSIKEDDGIITAVAADTASTYSATSTVPINGAGVAAALATLPQPMQFKGSLGTGGTITKLPTAASSNEGYMYKVITDGTYASQSAKVGDMFISDGSSWILIPSGDEPSGTVTSVGLTAGTAITISGDTSPITSSGTFTVSHGDTSSQSSIINSGYSYIQSIELDTYGHITSAGSGTIQFDATPTYQSTNLVNSGNILTAINKIPLWYSYSDNTVALVYNNADLNNSTYTVAGKYLRTTAFATVVSNCPTTYDFIMEVLTGTTGDDFVEQRITVIDADASKYKKYSRVRRTVSNEYVWTPWSCSGEEMVVISYGDTWADFIAAYEKNKIVYCRASSNSNPATGSKTRMAFMAYVNNESVDSITEVEFQYYRSVSTHTDSQQGDQVFVYKLNKTTGWSVTTRNAFTKINVTAPIVKTYTQGTSASVNISHAASGVTAGTYNNVTVDANGHVTSASTESYELLSRGTEITSGADLHTYKTPGVYYCRTSSTAAQIYNTPITQSGFRLVVTEKVSTDGTRIMHDIYSATQDVHYTECTYTDNSIIVWTPWHKVGDEFDDFNINNTIGTTGTITTDSSSEYATRQLSLPKGATTKNKFRIDLLRETTVNGITFTPNNDGTITVSGTASADASINISSVQLFENDTYVLWGCPEGGGENTYWLEVTGTRDYGNGTDFTINNNVKNNGIITVKSGISIVTPIIFKPMIVQREVARANYDNINHVYNLEFTPAAPTISDIYNFMPKVIDANNSQTGTDSKYSILDLPFGRWVRTNNINHLDDLPEDLTSSFFCEVLPNRVGATCKTIKLYTFSIGAMDGYCVYIRHQIGDRSSTNTHGVWSDWKKYSEDKAVISNSFALGTCTTEGNAPIKSVTISVGYGWKRTIGGIIGIKFAYTNTYNVGVGSETGPITLSVNGEEAQIYYNGTSNQSGTSPQCYGSADRYTYYVWDGTYWVWLSCGFHSENESSSFSTNVIANSTNYNISSDVFNNIVDISFRLYPAATWSASSNFQLFSVPNMYKPSTIKCGTAYSGTTVLPCWIDTNGIVRTAFSSSIETTSSVTGYISYSMGTGSDVAMTINVSSTNYEYTAKVYGNRITINYTITTTSQITSGNKNLFTLPTDYKPSTAKCGYAYITTTDTDEANGIQQVVSWINTSSKIYVTLPSNLPVGRKIVGYLDYNFV